MMRTLLLLAAGGLMPGLAGTGKAATITMLDFAGNICGVSGDQTCFNGAVIGQTYGDTAGVDVSSAVVVSGTDVVAGSIGYWGSGYGNLNGIAYGIPGSGISGSFTFAPNAGYEVRLLDFAAGCFGGRTSCATVDYLVTAGGATLESGSAVSTNFPGSAVVALNTAWASTPISLRWGPDLFYTGLDNIRFEWRAIDNGGGMPAIPEPASWAMLIAGFGLTGAVARRQRQRSVAA